MAYVLDKIPHNLRKQNIILTGDVNKIRSVARLLFGYADQIKEIRLTPNGEAFHASETGFYAATKPYQDYRFCPVEMFLNPEVQEEYV